MPPPTLFFIGFCANLLITLLIVRFIYLPSTQNKRYSSRNKRYVFTFVAFNSIIFFMMVILMTVDVSLGTGFGLFAILSLLRYRSETLTARDMTYLFVLIGLPVVNSIPLATDSGLPTLIVGNVCTIILLFVLEQGWGFPKMSPSLEQSKRVTYPISHLLKPENEMLLLDSLREQTGLFVTRVSVDRLNFIKNSAELTIHYNNIHLTNDDNDNYDMETPMSMDVYMDEWDGME